MSALSLNVFSLRDRKYSNEFFHAEETSVSGWRAIACLQKLRPGIDLSAERFDLPSLSDSAANSGVSLVTCPTIIDIGCNIRRDVK
jgi:hypothetical protein